MGKLQRNHQSRLKNPLRKNLDYPIKKQSDLLTNLGLGYLLYKILKKKDKKVKVKKSSVNQLTAWYLKGIVASLFKRGKSKSEIKAIIIRKNMKINAAHNTELLIEILKQMIWHNIEVEIGDEYTFDEDLVDVPEEAFNHWLEIVTSDDSYIDYALTATVPDIVHNLEANNIITKKGEI